MKLLSYLFGREPPDRRAATIQVTADALLGLFQLDGTQTLRMEGVPADAKVEAMWVDQSTQTLHIGIVSEELPLVTEGSATQPIYVSIYVTHQVPQEVRV